MSKEEEERIIKRLRELCANFRGGERDLCKIMRQTIGPLLDFRLAVMAVGPANSVVGRFDRVISVDAPTSVVRALKLAARLVRHPMILRLTNGGSPLVLDPSEYVSRKTRSIFRLMLPGRMVLYHRKNVQSGAVTYIVLAGIAETSTPKLRETFELVAPYAEELLEKMWCMSLAETPEFTHAELAIVKLLRSYKTNKEIARELQKSESTVRNQLYVIFSKLRVHSRVAAVGRIERLNPKRWDS